MRSASWFTSGPGSSDSNIWRPPIRNRGSTASASTMIPIPPSHWLSWRQIRIDRSSDSTSVTTVAPVVVNPDIPSKNASMGCDSCGSPERRYGRPAYSAARSQVSETTR